jgi:hypothetical protein
MSFHVALAADQSKQFFFFFFLGGPPSWTDTTEHLRGDTPSVKAKLLLPKKKTSDRTRRAS